MFSFFKRSKAQKGKQKHEKLQLAPQQEQQLKTNQLQSPTYDGPVEDELRLKGSVGSVCLGAISSDPPAAEACGNVEGGASKAVASDANASANANVSGPPAGDEEKQRAKNNNPHRPDPTKPPALVRPELAVASPGVNRVEWLPSKHFPPVRQGLTVVELVGASRRRGSGTDVELEHDSPNTATVSSSGPTYQSGSVGGTVTRGRANSDNDDSSKHPLRDDFPLIDNGANGGGDDRESSSPIDDNHQRRQPGTTQANAATSSNPYAPPSESATMAKGKNRRRYQPQQAQQVHHQQQQQQHQQQQQQVKGGQHQTHHQQQQQGVIRRTSDSSDLSELGGKKSTVGSVAHLTLAKAVSSIVNVDQATPIKVRRLEELAPERPATIESLANGDVTELGGLLNGHELWENPKATVEKPEPSPNTATSSDGVGDRVAKTHTINTASRGGSEGIESVAAVLACADAPKLATGGTGNTNTASTLLGSSGSGGNGEALLNIKNTTSPTTTVGSGGDVDGSTVEAHGGDDRALELGTTPGRPQYTTSSEPAAIPAISKQTTDAVVGNNGSVEETSAVGVVDTTIQEMGQQPSRTTTDSEAHEQRASKSTSPQRVGAPSPPPRTPRSSTSPVRPEFTPPPEQDAAPGDDTSDDRDVFYEAKETLSPPVVSAGGESRFESGVVASTSSGTPEPIRASLVLKIGPEPPGLTQVPAGGSPRRTERRKKQVSFKLTQNGSDDVEVTSVDSSEEEEEDDDDDDEEEDEDDSESVVPPTSTPSVTNSEFSHNHPTAFSNESNNSKPQPPPPATFGVCSFGGESVGQRNYIEFKYDNNSGAQPPATAATTLHGGSPGPKEVHGSVDGKQLLNGGSLQQTSVSVLIEDSVASLPDVVQQPTTGLEPHGKSILPPASFTTVEKINSEMKDLVNQECRYSAKLEEAEKRVNEANTKVYELQQKLDAVERDALLKEYNVERLQAELVAALKECDGIRARLTTQQAEMEAIRLKASEREDELNLRYQNLEVEQLELNEKLKEVRNLAHDLNSQLLDAKSEVDRLKTERQLLLDARTEEQKIMREALEESINQRAQVEAKWKHDFEQLRNVNNDREEHLMKDCEFTVRNMQKTCKEKVETADRERKQVLEKMGRLEEQARRQTDEVRHLKSIEAEVEQLRGLTFDQKEALASMTRQVEGLKAELQTAYNRIEEEMVKVQQIKNRCEYQLCEKEREALNRIEIARGEIAMQWEDRLLHEMNRLKVELEQMHMEERTSALEKMRREALAETEAMSQRFNAREQQLKAEIESLKATVEQQKITMSYAQSEADQKLIQSRMYVERAEREHEQKLAKEMDEKNEIIDTLKRRFEQEKLALEQQFTNRIQQVQEEFAREISDTTELMKSTHKKELEDQWKSLVAEKEEALKLMDSRNRTRLEDAENKVRELTTSHQRQLKDLQEEHSFVVHSLESRDTKNTQEIQTLHKKCRCLTNLFEEMRLRYERRESRPEDLQEIDDLKRVIDSQERDLRLLTEALREAQLKQMQQQQQQQQQQQHVQQQPPPPPRRSKPNRGKQSKQQQQQQQGGKQQQQKQQKNSRPPYPPPEPELMQPEAGEGDDHETDEAVGYVQSLAPQVAPQVVLIPPPQLIPPMVHRTMCDVIYEENEADILREEEESHQELRENHPHPTGEETVEVDDNEELQEEQMEDANARIVVVDVPASAIQTEDRAVQSTTPTIIEELEVESSSPTEGQVALGGKSTISQFTVVVPIENIEDANIRPRAPSTPRIVITDDTEKDTNCGGTTTVVEISEEPPSCVTPVIELPAVFAKIYPSEVPTEAIDNSAPSVVHSGPEMIVIRAAEGHGKGST